METTTNKKETSNNKPAFKSARLAGVELAGWNNGGFMLTKYEKDQDGNWDRTKISLRADQIIILHHHFSEANAWLGGNHAEQSE